MGVRFILDIYVLASQNYSSLIENGTMPDWHLRFDNFWAPKSRFVHFFKVVLGVVYEVSIACALLGFPQSPKQPFCGANWLRLCFRWYFKLLILRVHLSRMKFVIWGGSLSLKMLQWALQPPIVYHETCLTPIFPCKWLRCFSFFIVTLSLPE